MFTSIIANYKNERHISHCSLATSYSDIDLGKHWLRQWLVAGWHQVIYWTNVDSPLVRYCGIYMKAISKRVSKLLFCIMSLKTILLKLLPHLPRPTLMRLCEIIIWSAKTENLISENEIEMFSSQTNFEISRLNVWWPLIAYDGYSDNRVNSMAPGYLKKLLDK